MHLTPATRHASSAISEIPIENVRSFSSSPFRLRESPDSRRRHHSSLASFTTLHETSRSLLRHESGHFFLPTQSPLQRTVVSNESSSFSPSPLLSHIVDDDVRPDSKMTMSTSSNQSQVFVLSESLHTNVENAEQSTSSQSVPFKLVPRMGKSTILKEKDVDENSTDAETDEVDCDMNVDEVEVDEIERDQVERIEDIEESDYPALDFESEDNATTTIDDQTISEDSPNGHVNEFAKNRLEQSEVRDSGETFNK